MTGYRAPSVYLDFNDINSDGDIIMNTIRVASPATFYTYYCALIFGGGNDGGGYCGMQYEPNGNNFIFSLWDPKTVKEPIIAEYIGAGTEIYKFDNEGFGLKSLNYSLCWAPNEWYTFVTRVWSFDAHSHYGFWIFDHKNNIWHHLVTMDYPVDNLKFKSVSSFIEDWEGNGSQLREFHLREGWKRNLNFSWIPFSQSVVKRVKPDAGCANYIENYDCGVIANEYYFIKSGGTATTPTTISGTAICLPNSNTSPKFIACKISNLFIDKYTDSIELQWTVNSSKSPQYSCVVEIYDNAAFSGSPIIKIIKVKPHIRMIKIKDDNLSLGDYYCKLFIYDIFGNRSNELTKLLSI